MKNFLINILKFIAFSIPFYVIGLCIWCWIVPSFLAKNVRSNIAAYGHLFSRTRDAENIKNPDILFLGSSHAFRGFDTRVFAKKGLKTFNLGGRAQSPINTQVFLKQYLHRMKPKLVIYEVYPLTTFGVDGVESSLDMLSNSKIDKNSLDMAYKVNNFIAYNTIIYGYFRQVFNLNKNIKEPISRFDDFYVKGGGYVETTFSKYQKQKISPSKWQIIPSQVEALKENIKILKDSRTPFILLQTPITKTLYNSKTNNKEVENLLQHIGTYKNFQNEVNLNDEEDFYDSDHLNQIGVEKFNNKLIEYLYTQNENIKK